MSPSTAFARARCVEEGYVAAPREKEANPVAAKLRADGSVCFRVLGGSMFPWIRSGDLVFVRSFAYEQASRGDVVLFERGDRLFVHRVIKVAVTASSAGQRALITKATRLIGKMDRLRVASF